MILGTCNKSLIWLHQSEQQKVNSSPSPQQVQKEESTPELPATGKESSNPVTAVDLPKIKTEVQTSTTPTPALVRPSDILSLKPNGGKDLQSPQIGVKAASLQDEEKGIQIPNKHSKPYYVVFNGPNAGIFDSWEVAKLAIEGISGVKHKKYRSLLEAKVTADRYSREQCVEPLDLISSAHGLKPNSFAKALTIKKQKTTSLGKLPARVQPKPKLEQDEDPSDLSKQRFDYNYRTARSADDSSISEMYFTTTGSNLSYYNFMKGANPVQVYEAFCYGLVKSIYPSQNLQELKEFPKMVRQTVKQFRTKCIKGEKDIFLKVNSSVPWWKDNGEYVAPTHMIQIGICGKETYKPSVPTPCQLEEKDYPQLGKMMNERLLNILNSFHQDDRIFVNYCGNNYLIYSKSAKVINSADEQKILSFKDKISKIVGKDKKKDKMVEPSSACKSLSSEDCEDFPALRSSTLTIKDNNDSVVPKQL